MPWSAIVAGILGVVLPFLKKWLAAWLEGHLHDTAARMGRPVAFARLESATDNGEASATASRALLEAARGRLWPWNVRKRRLLAEMIEHVPPAVAGEPLTIGRRLAIREAADAC